MRGKKPDGFVVQVNKIVEVLGDVNSIAQVTLTSNNEVIYVSQQFRASEDVVPHLPETQMQTSFILELNLFSKPHHQEMQDFQDHPASPPPTEPQDVQGSDAASMEEDIQEVFTSVDSSKPSPTLTLISSPLITADPESHFIHPKETPEAIAAKVKDIR